MVTGISPSSGPTLGGTVVTITGSGLLGATAVNFGSSSATSFTVNSDTSITATAPAGTGAVDVTVTAPGGTSATSAADLYTYVVLPQTITFTQPAPAYAGTAVLLSATGGSSPSPVVFSVISGPATATGTNGSTLTYTGAGTVVVEADQAGDANYAAATPVRQTVTVTVLTEPVGTPSVTVTTLMTFTASGTLGAIGVGGLGTDFQLGSSGTCTQLLLPTQQDRPAPRNSPLLQRCQGMCAMAAFCSRTLLNTGTVLAASHIYGIGVGSAGELQSCHPERACQPQPARWSCRRRCRQSVRRLEVLPASLSINQVGTVKTINSSFVNPTGVAVDGSGNVFVTDASSNTVSELLAPGLTTVVSALALDGTAPAGIAVDGNGNVFVADSR